jgi:predicted PurR-regulated permease PerM
MTAGPRQRVALTPASAVRVAVVAVLAVAVLIALGRSRLILHWLVTAAAAALLLDGLVRALARYVRRGLAVAAVTILTLVGAGLLTYGVVDTAFEQYKALRQSAPAAAASLERSDRVGGLATRLEFADRTEAVVEQAPERLFGSPADAAQTAARGLGEVLLVITLTIFMLVAYERFEQRIQDVDAASRQGLGRWAGLDAGVSAGATNARRLIGRVLVLGAITAVVAEVAGVPAPLALGLWMAWWRLLPLVGVAVGYAPLVLLPVTDRSLLVVAGALLALAAAEAGVRWALGTCASAGGLGLPMGLLTALAFSGGVEMAGVVGAVVAVVLAHVAVGAARAALEQTDGDPSDGVASGAGSGPGTAAAPTGLVPAGPAA